MKYTQITQWIWQRGLEIGIQKQLSCKKVSDPPRRQLYEIQGSSQEITVMIG